MVMSSNGSAAADEAADHLGDRFDDLGTPISATSEQDGFQSRLPKHLFGGIVCFGDAIGEDVNTLTGGQRELSGRVNRVGPNPENDALSALDQLDCLSVQPIGGIVAGIAKLNYTCPGVNIARKSVTNIMSLLSWQSSRLTRVTMSAGLAEPPLGERMRSAAMRIRLLARAMNSAAGMPLPETSPTRKHSLPFSVRKKS
jgi:hypothetical protein